MLNYWSASRRSLYADCTTCECRWSALSSDSEIARPLVGELNQRHALCLRRAGTERMAILLPAAPSAPKIA
jgi:hypothetical protein